MKKNILIFFTILFAGAKAQDIKCAYIRTTYVSNNTYSIIVTLISDASLNISRQNITVTLGDGATNTLTVFSSSNYGNNNIKIFSGTHTYPGPGIYTVNYTDSFRVVGIKNLNFSNTQKIMVQSTINNTNIFGIQNATPQITNWPINLNLLMNNAIYSPDCSYQSGDSISFSLKSCFNNSSYYIPAGTTFNYTNGLLTFPKDSTGLYAFSFVIKQWRKNVSGYYDNTAANTSQLDFVMDINSTIGIKNNLIQNNLIKLYPNPANDKLTVTLSEVEAPFLIQIINTLGEVIQSNDLQQPITTINIQSLPNGIYFLKINNSTQTFKLIKN